MAVPKSNYLSAQRQSLPEIGNNSSNKLSSVGRNSISVQNQEQPTKKDREYVRRIIQESKRNNLSVDGDSGQGQAKLKWD